LKCSCAGVDGQAALITFFGAAIFFIYAATITVSFIDFQNLQGVSQ